MLLRMAIITFFWGGLVITLSATAAAEGTDTPERQFWVLLALSAALLVSVAIVTSKGDRGND